MRTSGGSCPARSGRTADDFPIRYRTDLLHVGQLLCGMVEIQFDLEPAAERLSSTLQGLQGY
jgi:hypothetical protein